MFGLFKTEWVVVRKELIDEKGIDSVCADKIGEYAKLNGNFNLMVFKIIIIRDK